MARLNLPLQNPFAAKSPRYIFGFIELLWGSGGQAEALQHMHTLVGQLATQVQQQATQVQQQQQLQQAAETVAALAAGAAGAAGAVTETALLARCYHKIGQWTQELHSPDGDAFIRHVFEPCVLLGGGGAK